MMSTPVSCCISKVSALAPLRAGDELPCKTQCTCDIPGNISHRVSPNSPAEHEIIHSLNLLVDGQSTVADLLVQRDLANIWEFVREKVRGNEGFTFDPLTMHEAAKSGYVVALQGYEAILPETPTGDQLLQEVAHRVAVIVAQRHQQHLWIGGWFDEESGNYVLDLAVRIQDIKEAIRFGIAHEQRSIHNLATGRNLPLSGPYQSSVAA